MARHSRNRLFEELGLLDEPEQSNPYGVLGLDPSFVNNLLREDPTGSVVKLAADALRRVLTKRYHPDIPRTGNADRFRQVNEANSQIEEASRESLVRWAQVERTQSSERVKKVQLEREALIGRSAELFQTNLELGNHSQHFSQLQWAQGVLLQRRAIPLLLRQHPEGGIRITKGWQVDIGEIKRSAEETPAFNFSRFLLQHHSFGLEPGASIIAYIDQDQRASILGPDLTFMMDITDPVAAHREKRERLKTRHRNPMEDADYWSRSRDPVLFITTVPLVAKPDPSMQVFTFPDQEGGQNRAWDLPLEVVGTANDPEFYRRVRHSRTAEATALSGGAGQQTASYFSLAATPARKFVEDNPQYSPLLVNNASLVLYDIANRVPVMTDVRIIGMVGSNSQAA